MTEEEMLERLTASFETHVDAAQEVLSVEMRMIEWIALHGLLQLALRHPATDPDMPSSVAARWLIDRIETVSAEKGLFDAETLEQLRANQRKYATKSRRVM